MGERRVPRPSEQSKLWDEAEAVKEIEKAIVECKDAEANRLSWQKVESEARAALQEVLKSNGYTTADGYKRGPYLAWLEASDVKAKCRVAEVDEGE